MENELWLEILQGFIAVRNLYLSKEIARRIVPSLQELVGARTREVLPSLQNIFLEELEQSGPVQEGIGKIAAARQLSGYPIAVSLWENDPEWDSDSEWRWDPESESESESYSESESDSYSERDTWGSGSDSDSEVDADD